MALTHHIIYKDGRLEHRDFSPASWEAALKDSTVHRHWGEPPDDCHDPIARFKERHPEQPKSPPPPKVAPVEEAVDWPPQSPLTPWMLSHLTTLSVDDARGLLSTPVKHEVVERRPITDKNGQFSLF